MSLPVRPHTALAAPHPCPRAVRLSGWAAWRDGRAGAWLALLALLALLPFLAGMVPIVRFARERIDIALYRTEIHVSGRYVYRNPWPFPVTQGFTVPVPLDTDHPAPTELRAARVSPDPAPLPVRRVLGRIGFEVRFRPFEEVQVAVRYRQFAPTRDGRYLLTTTRPWGRPLEHALYTVRLHDVVLVHSSYALQPRADGVQAFERTRFLPPDDWRLAWR
jgi:hypothetical protein